MYVCVSKIYKMRGKFDVYSPKMAKLFVRFSTLPASALLNDTLLMEQLRAEQFDLAIAEFISLCPCRQATVRLDNIRISLSFRRSLQ